MLHVNKGPVLATGELIGGGHQKKGGACGLTCLQSDASRLRLLVEMVRLIVMPANCRLLFPRMEFRQRDEGCEERGAVHER